MRFEINCNDGSITTREETVEEIRLREESHEAFLAERAQETINRQQQAESLDEMRQHIAELQALVASLTKGVQTAP